MIKTKPFKLTPFEYFLFHLKITWHKLIIYTLLSGFIFYLKWFRGKELSAIDIALITFMLTVTFLPIISAIFIGGSSKNSTFFELREIEITDQFLIESKEDGSLDKVNLSRFRSIKETRNFYFMFNSSLTFLAIKKDSFLTLEDHEKFKVQILENFKKNGFIEL